VLAVAALASIPAIFFVLESTRAERLDPPPVTRVPDAIAPDAGPIAVAPAIATAPHEPDENEPRPRVRTKRAGERANDRTGERMTAGTGPPLWMWD
jgi:hypothetical protein